MKTMLRLLHVGIWICCMISVPDLLAQTTGQYAFSTNNTGSLVLDRNGNAINMSTGTTQLIGAGVDDQASAVTNIGFTFRFIGTNFTQFSASSNGGIRLGGTSISATTIGSSFPVNSQDILAPYLGDLETHSNGRVHFRLFGTAPNRVLVVEFQNMRINFNSTTNDATFQARIYETTNIIEYVYGAMAVGSTSTNNSNATDARTVVIGIQEDNGTDQELTVNQSTYAFTSSSSTIFNTNSSTGAIAGLNSSTDGSRRRFTFIPPQVNTGTISGSPFCSGVTLVVPFTSAGVFTSNTYTAQLSNSSGSFASPVNIGTLVSNANSGNISATIPANAVNGTGYRIRVISNNSEVLSFDNGANLTINASPVVSAGSSVCVGANISLSPATGGTWVSNNPTAASVTNAGLVTGLIAGSSTFTFINSTTGCSATTSSVNVIGNATLSLTSAVSTSNQTVCVSSGIVSITYLVGGSGTGASATGLPAGVTGSYNGGTNVFTISGAPTVSGTFNYTVNTTGPCGNTSLGGTINVNSQSAIALSSGTSTTNQAVCRLTPIASIVYTASGSTTGANVTGLPAGVNAVYDAGVLTISGSPTATGTFNYTVTTTGPCPNSLNGTILVRQLPSVSVLANPASVCIGQSSVLTATNSGGATQLVFTGSNTNNVSIPNNSNNSYTYSSVNLSAGSSTLSTSDLLQVTVNISHNDLSDLDIFLVDPSGTRAMLLSSDNGGSGNNYTNTVLSTAASNIIGSGGNNSAPFTGTYRPEGTIATAPDRGGAASGGNYNSVIPANALNGAAINGNWTLRVFDDNTNSSGTLLNWSLTITKQGSYVSVFNGPATIVPAAPTGENINPTATVTAPVGINNYTVTTTDVHGCSSTSLPVAVTVIPNVQPGTVTGSSPLCIGATSTFSSNGDAGGTWSSSNTSVATVDPNTGLVTAVGAGSANIVYTITSGCGSPASSSSSLTVSPNASAGIISGTSPLCIGATATYSSNGDAGGTWSSSNASVASVDANTGLVTALAAGSADIIYTVTTGCNAPFSAFASLTVSPNVNAGTVSGTSPLCIGATATYSSNGDAGGTWSSSNPSVATVDPNTGLVTAISAGSANIVYNITAGCASPVSAFAALTVNPNASAGNVTGASPLCIGATAAYSSNGDAGGTWSSSNTSVATVDPNNGLVAAVGAGTANIVYTVSAGCNAPFAASASITVSPDASAGVISGPSSLCTATDVLFSSNGDAGGVWSSNNNAVATVNPGTGLVSAIAPGNAVISYTVNTGCNAPFTTTKPIVVTAGGAPVVTGQVNICPFVGNNIPVTYTAFTPGATAYQWTVPPHVSILSGQGTANLTVTFNTQFGNAANKQIRVRAQTPCGNSPLTIYYLLSQFPTTPRPIVASSTDVCPSLGTNLPITFTIPKVTAATSYIWTTQSGTTTVTHPNGPGENDTTVTVTFSNSFTTSLVTVQAVNACGTSGTRSFTLTRANPGTPAIINGPANVCAFIAPGNTAATYAVAQQPGVTSYNWSIPAGALSVNGQGTSTVSFIYPPGFNGGGVSVAAVNGCGSSTTPRHLSVATLNPGAPSPIDVQVLSFCPNRQYSYTLASVPANATSVNWTVPAGATIESGQGTTSITVSYPAESVNGAVTAQAVNNCGASVIRSTQIKLPACPPEEFTRGTGMIQLPSASVDGLDVKLFPNPSVSDFRLQVNSTDKNAQVTVRVLDLGGRELSRMILMPDALKSFGANLKPGTYMIEVLQAGKRTVQKVVKM